MKLRIAEFKELMWVSSVKYCEVDAVLAVLRRHAEEQKFNHYIPENIKEILEQLIKLDQVLVLRKEDSTIVGLLAFSVTQNPFLVFKKQVAQELVWCVDKPHRKYSKMLVSLYEERAKELGCTSVILSHLEEGRFKLLGKVFKTLGYKKLETMYEKELT